MYNCRLNMLLVLSLTTILFTKCLSTATCRTTNCWWCDVTQHAGVGRSCRCATLRVWRHIFPFRPPIQLAVRRYHVKKKVKDARHIYPRQRIAVSQQTWQEDWNFVILNNGDFIQQFSRVSTPIVTWRDHIICWHAVNYNWPLGDFGMITLHWYNSTCIRIRIMSLVTAWVQGER